MYKDLKANPKLDQKMHELRALVLTMAGYIEEMVELSMRALVLRDQTQLERIESVESQVNSLHKKIDNKCFKILACQSPVTADLRLILAIIKINVDLERMGDLARNNSYAIKDYLASQPDIVVQTIKQMATTVMRMVRDSFDAFMDRDLKKSQEVLKIDDAVDQFRTQISYLLQDKMKDQGADLKSILSLLSVVRNLERLADHATNIAEEVIFYLTGLDIRHRNAIDQQGDL